MGVVFLGVFFSVTFFTGACLGEEEEREGGGKGDIRQRGREVG